MNVTVSTGWCQLLINHIPLLNSRAPGTNALKPISYEKCCLLTLIDTKADLRSQKNLLNYQRCATAWPLTSTHSAGPTQENLI